MAEKELIRQLAFIRTAPGSMGSGLVRYGAAMHLYQVRFISAEILEVFRICALDDRLDPLAELQRLDLDHDVPFLKETSPA
jgi:hypothetical protein